MNTPTLRPFIARCTGAALIACAALLPSTAVAQATAAATSSDGVGTAQMEYVIATVTAVDQKARTVTVKTEDGNETALAVGEDVKRLSEVKVGDQLSIGYLQSIGLEFREPTAEELADPYKVTEVTDRASTKEAPAGGKARTLRAVVTLEGASRWLNALTVKGPRGNYLVIEVEPGTVKWESLRIGQKMVGTYTEALVMSLEPAPKK